MDGHEIKVLRQQLELTQEEFAHKVGVTFATVNRWENHKSKPSKLALRILNMLQEATPAPKKAAKKKAAPRRRTPKKKA
jgi:DNA-binding transcriptional regulator YiaG